MSVGIKVCQNAAKTDPEDIQLIVNLSFPDQSKGVSDYEHPKNNSDTMNI